MVYIPTVWTDRTVERPLTFTMSENGDGSVTLIPAEGNIIASGTPITSSNLNKIENGIAEALPQDGGTLNGEVVFTENALLSGNVRVLGALQIEDNSEFQFNHLLGIKMDEYGDISLRDDTLTSPAIAWVVYSQNGDRRLVIPVGGSEDTSENSLELNPPTLGNVKVGGGINTIITTKSGGTMTTFNGWVNYNVSTYDEIGYVKLATGLVVVKGLVKSGSLNLTIATLPVGCRPNNRRTFACFTGSGLARVDVMTDGKIQQVSGSNDALSLSNIQFFAEN